MPSDLIYREDAKDFVRHAYNKGLNPIDYLDEVPAADVVEVVRCKDCIHAPLPGDCEGNDMEWPKIDGIYEDCICPHCCGDNWYSTRPDPDGFCEKGERREDERQWLIT